MSRREKPNPPPSTGNHKATSVDELTAQNVQAIARLEAAARRERALSDRFADAVARFCGSMTFFWTHVVGFSAWITFNYIPFLPPFDPFPFNFLTLVVSLEAIFLSTFILISQNQETKLTERRNHLDLQINLLAEQENTKMLRMLTAIGKKVGASVGDDPDAAALEQATRPDHLAQQIEKAVDATDKDKKAPSDKAGRK